MGNIQYEAFARFRIFQEYSSSEKHIKSLRRFSLAMEKEDIAICEIQLAETNWLANGDTHEVGVRLISGQQLCAGEQFDIMNALDRIGTFEIIEIQEMK